MTVRPQRVIAGGHARKAVEEGVEVDGVSDADGGEGGVRAPRKVQDPRRPSESEVAEHELTHLPFRSWCTHCIRGRGEATPHARAERDDDGVPEVHMDYCFLGGRSDEAQPVLVIRERDTKMLLSFLVREKGANDPYVIRRVMAFLTELGHTGNKVIIKTDQESPVRAVAAKIAAERQEGRTILENSPVKSSGSNGVIERGVKEFEYQVRTMKSALDQRLGIKVKGDSNILPWMIEYSSVLLNRYLVGKDGSTAHERMKGKKSKMLGFEFAESVHFRRVPPPGRLAKLESLWETGIVVGYRSNSGEFMVANQAGVYKTRNIRRKPVEERWDKDAVEGLKFTPWRVREQAARDTDQPLREQQLQPHVDIQVDESLNPDVPPPKPAEAIPRRVYITRAVLEKYGFTDGCLGCTNSAVRLTGIVHSDECRKRIESAMHQDVVDKARLQESKRKREEFVSRHLGPDKVKRANVELKSAGTIQGGASEQPLARPAESASGSSSSCPGAAEQQHGSMEQNTRPREKRKREGDDPGDEERMSDERLVMEVMCEQPVVEAEPDWETDVKSYQEAELEEKPWHEGHGNWADMSEEDQADQEVIYDDLTGRILKYEHVIRARLDEIEALKKMGVWETVPLSQCWEKSGRKPIRGRWVDINKGDDVDHNYRSRYVAQEVRQAHGGAHREGLFAAMPPIEALKLVISRAVTANSMGETRNRKLLFMDISKAYLHADVMDQELYVDLPEEMRLLGQCGRLKKALYGTREAARCWEKEYTRTLETLQFVRGRTSPCLFRHRLHDCVVFIHGDDIVACGEHGVLQWLQEEVSNKYLTKVRGLLGPEPADKKTIVILNRVLEWRNEGIAIEADPRHVELMLQEMGMQNCKGSEVMGPAPNPADEIPLTGKDATQFRSLAARCNFLSSDRVDIQFACKEACRRMAAPTTSDWAMLKKMARYLKAHPRMIVEFKYQQMPQHLTVRVDTDYAGCKRTRRSTNGGMIMLGNHLIKNWATTQTVVAISSGEAEYYGVTKGACEGLGVVGLMEDLGGGRMPIVLETDSSAAKGIATRRGVGKVKHLETRTLWVQDQVERGRLKVKKIDGPSNTADVLTKYLPARTLTNLLRRLPLAFEHGRSTIAAQLQGRPPLDSGGRGGV